MEHKERDSLIYVDREVYGPLSFPFLKYSSIEAWSFINRLVILDELSNNISTFGNNLYSLFGVEWCFTLLYDVNSCLKIHEVSNYRK